MRLPRFTIRRLMIAVAIVAVLFWVNRLRQLSTHYRSEVERCEQGFNRRGVVCYFSNPQLSPEENAKHRQEYFDWLDRSGEYYLTLKIKYERAARYPWLAVEPDPPEPAIIW